ncbi:MAG: hypothetical protein ABEJ58_02350 [Halodesulfurarchaeum sp.]
MRLAGLTVACLVVLAGCAGTVPGEPRSTTRDPPTQCAEWVSFFGEPGEFRWDRNHVAIGYTLSPNASVFFVAIENDSIVGVSSHHSTLGADHPVTADGDRIELERNLSGVHTIRVVAVRDSNRNGRFDPATDQPCREDGEVIQAGPRALNFSLVGPATPAS